MEYTENFNRLFAELKKSASENDRLNYFKSKLLQILDSKEKNENTISKAIDNYCYNLNKSLYAEYAIEKGKVGTIGEIRTWKDGHKYKKMPNGKWVRVYQEHNRSAEISIARLKGKVRNATTVDELMEIVMANVHRFEDENGQILPIVEELKKEVAASKGKINAGKPSTQEQIEKYKKEHEVKVSDDDLNKIDIEIERAVFNAVKNYTYAWDWELNRFAKEFVQKSGDAQKDNAKTEWLKRHSITNVDELSEYLEHKGKQFKENQKAKKAAKKKEKLEKARDMEYQKPESSKTFEKLTLDDAVPAFNEDGRIKLTVQKVFDFMNENPAEDNNINYLFKKMKDIDFFQRKGIYEGYGMNRKKVGEEYRQLSIESLENSNSNKRCHYSPGNVSILVKEVESADNVKEIETFIHEMTHWLDACCFTTLNDRYGTNQVASKDSGLLKALSKSIISSFDDIPDESRKLIESYENNTEYKKFSKAAKEELAAMPLNTNDEIKAYNQRAKEVNEEGKKLWKDHCKETEPIGGLEDMYMAISAGRVKDFTWGHTDFKDRDRRSSELLANYISLSFTKKDQIAAFKKDMPNIAMALDQVIANMVDLVDSKTGIKKSLTETINTILKGVLYE